MAWHFSMARLLPVYSPRMTFAGLGLGLWLATTMGPISAVLALGGKVADHVESYGGHSLGLAGGGAGGAVTGVGAVRINPSLLLSTQDYQVSAGMHWPSFGKNYYQLGVVDGTGPVKAGFLFTSPLKSEFQNPYHSTADDGTALSLTERQDAFWGTKMQRAYHLGLAYAFHNVALGIAGSYTQGWMRRYRSYAFTEEDGISLSGGISLRVIPEVQLGASFENQNNQGIQDLAPVFYRVGAVWYMVADLVSLHGDYTHRQRIRSERVEVGIHDEGHITWNSLFESVSEIDEYERMVIVSAKLRIQDLMRLFGGYGMEVGPAGLKRNVLAAGIALVSDIYELSYQVRRPYLSSSELHQNLYLSLLIKM